MVSLDTVISVGLLFWLAYSAYSMTQRPKSDKEEMKYEGDFDEEGRYHGPGRLELKGGDVFAGNFVNGELVGAAEYYKTTTQATVRSIKPYFCPTISFIGLSKSFTSTCYFFHLFLLLLVCMYMYVNTIMQLYGEFKDGWVTGKGRGYRADGSWYDGGFLRGMRSLTGTAHFANHNMGDYVGGWVDGLRHGDGVIFFSDGSRFEGSFVRGLRDGSGILYKSDGTVIRGLWRGGKKVDTEHLLASADTDKKIPAITNLGNSKSQEQDNEGEDEGDYGLSKGDVIDTSPFSSEQPNLSRRSVER